LSLDAAPGKPERIDLCFTHNVPEEARTLPNWKDLHVPVTHGSTWDWRRATIPADALNLLWGDFAPRLKVGEWWPILRPAVLILLAALCIEMLGANIEWAMLASEKRSLMQDMEHSYRTTFGESSMLVNAPLQMQRNLADLRHGAGLPDDGDFLPLLDAASKTLAGLAPGSLQSLHYESGRLDLDIRLAKSGDFPNLKRQLQTSGLKVQIADAHDAGNGAQARLSLMPGDGS
jgi:general secretion pathway protein L